MSPRTRTPSLLVRNAQVVTMDPDRRVLRSGWLAVDSDRIVGLGPGNDCPTTAGRLPARAGGDRAADAPPPRR